MPDGKDNGKEVKPTPAPWGKFSNSFGDLQQELKRRSQQTKHTPGPWVHKKDERLDEYDNPGVGWNARFLWSPGHSGVCHVMLQHDDGESEANARLIAAAPELLEALEDVSKAYQEMFDVMPVAWQTIDDLVTSAIAKAKGET